MNIYVGNLSLDVTEDDLGKSFSAFGEVTSITVMNDKYIGSGQTRGYAYIEMPSLTEGEAAISAFNGKSFKQRTLCVIQALPLTQKHDRPATKYFGRTRHRPLQQAPAP
jgi:cold-inducible RNA-binding protein